MGRKMIRVEVGIIVGEWEDPVRVIDHIEMWNGKLDRVPEEYREKLYVEFSLEEGFEGSHFIMGSLYYERLETDEEMNKRLEKEAKKSIAQEAWERQELARLTEKYKGRES